MLKRTHIAAIALAAATASTGALADDGDVRHAQRLLEQARGYGTSQVTGQAAGQVETRRAERREAEALSADEKRWREIQKAQSLN